MISSTKNKTAVANAESGNDVGTKLMRIEFFASTNMWYIVDTGINLAVCLKHSKADAVAECEKNNWRFVIQQEAA